MDRETSLYLDGWRFALAMVVLLNHAASAELTGGLFWQFKPYGSQAVSVFFVLSGFVIAFVADTRESSAAEYALARAVRIYSVALPALMATFVLDAFGRTNRPDLYTASWRYVHDGRAWQFISGALFVNRFWGINTPQGSDLPYWSLGCEVWYYVIFGLYLFAPKSRRAVAIAFVLLAVGPLTALLFPLWLIGVAGYRICRDHRPGPAAGWALFAAPIALWIAYEATAKLHGRAANVAPRWLDRPELVQDYVVGLLFMAHLIGFRAVSASFAALFAPLWQPVRWLAGATFTIYLFHVPVAHFLASFLDVPSTSSAARVVVLAGTFVACLAIAEVTERRKAWWRAVFERAGLAAGHVLRTSRLSA